MSQLRSLVLSVIRQLNSRPSTLVIIAISLFIIVVWQVPRWQVNYLPASNPQEIAKKAELENTYRATLVNALGGLFFFITAGIAWRNLKATEQNIKVSEEKQITERYTQAINQLGSDKLEVRLGGIYALERLAKDSAKDYWTVIEVLSSFVREKSLQPNEASQNKKPQPLIAFILEKQSNFNVQGQKQRKITTDVWAALTVIIRRNVDEDLKNQVIDLSNACLVEINLSEVNFSRAKLSEAKLVLTKLIRANLVETNLMGTDLTAAFLMNANLWGANLMEACLLEARLIEANLEAANLWRAKLIGTDLRRANLQGAYLEGANLWGANLKGANLKGANLKEVNLERAYVERANFEKTENLTPEQVKSATSWELGIYSEDFSKELGLSPKSEDEKQGE